MAYQRDLERVQDEIDQQQGRCASARIAYSKGTGSVADCNREERKLADLHQRKWRISGGLVSDDR
jgi:hypothetical protein